MAAENQKALATGLGPKPEPSEILAGISLTGKRVVVTGGYSGIGFETVAALANSGAEIILPARRPDNARIIMNGLSDGLRQKITVAQMDLADLASVSRFAADMKADGKPVDLLINNAGIMACPETRTDNNWEAQFATNHLGHFVLAQGLLPLLRKADGARVVALSSIAHKRSAMQWEDIHFQQTPYEKWTAYAQAKTANSLFTLWFDEREQGNGIRAFSVHPGGIMTPLQRHLEKEEMIALGWIDENGETPEAAKPFFKTPAQGASTTLWCATSPEMEDKGGVYCENCNIANMMVPEKPYSGVAPHAVDDAEAERLWKESIRMMSI